MIKVQQKVYLYEIIINKLVDYIVNNNLQVGDAIPPERELAIKFDCNYHTMRKAILVMIERSLLERKHGSGTFIRSAVENVTTTAVRRVAFQQKNLLGVIIPSHANRFYSKLLLDLFDITKRDGYELVVTPINDFDAASLLIPERLYSQGCQAIIILHNNINIASNYLEDFVRMSKIPIVLTQRIKGFEDLSYDTDDNFGLTSCEEMIFACNYFNSLDYKNIFILAPKSDHRQRVGNVKVNAYYNKMISFGLQPRIFEAENDFSNIKEIVAECVALPGRKAIICHDDNYALHLMIAALVMGCKIPEDFAILGCNGDEELATLPIALSTIQFPYEYLINSILDKARRMLGQDVPPRELPIVVPTIRESCNGRNYFGNKLDFVINSLVNSVRFESKNISFKTAVKQNELRQINDTCLQAKAQ